MISFSRLDFELLQVCFFIWFISYTAVIAVIEFSIWYLLAPLALFIGLSYMSLKPPGNKIVDSVLGVDRRIILRNLDSSRPTGASYTTIAHKAACMDGPGNSLYAMKLCHQKGCRYIHVDVRFTLDSSGAVCENDDIVLKYSSETKLKKPIEESDWDEIDKSELDFDDFYYSDERIHKISSLDDVIGFCKKSNMKILMNLKVSTYHKSLITVVHTIIKMYEDNPLLYENCVISSANCVLLFEIRRRDLNIVVALGWSHSECGHRNSISWLKSYQRMDTFWKSLLDNISLWFLNNLTYRIIGISAVILPKDIITPGIVEYWEKKNIRVIAAVINLSAEKEYCRNILGVTYLTDTLQNDSVFVKR